MELIKKRWSPVAFSDRAVTPREMEALFEAARWAPSSYNAQPWRFFYGLKGDDMYPVLYNLINAANRTWARTAPALVLVVAETVFSGRDKPNRHAYYDTGMAVGQMLIKATEMDLYAHQMGGFDVERSVNDLSLPPHQEPVAMMAVGYKGDPSQLPAEVAERENAVRNRKPVDELVLNRNFES